MDVPLFFDVFPRAQDATLRDLCLGLLLSLPHFLLGSWQGDSLAPNQIRKSSTGFALA